MLIFSSQIVHYRRHSTKLLFKKVTKRHLYKYFSAEKKVFTLPNYISFSRIILSPIGSILLYNNYIKSSLCITLYCAGSDVLDGWIARKWNSRSVLGSVLDPIGDKVLITTMSIALASKTLPLYLAFIYVAKDLFLVLGGIFIRWRSLKSQIPKNTLTFYIFFNPLYKFETIKPSLISKFNTCLQISTLSLSIFSILNSSVDPILDPLFWTSGFTTCVSLIDYIFQYKKFLHKI